MTRFGRWRLLQLIFPGMWLVGLWQSVTILAQEQHPIRFQDVTQASGIDFRHTDGSCGKYFMLESMSGGVAILDFDLDGYPDIYFLNGRRLDQPQSQNSATNRLYRNEGNWRFRDVTQEAGVGDRGFGLGVSSGDYDNDGDPDLFVNNYGPNAFYLNNGDGTFTEVAARIGLESTDKAGGGSGFFDADHDGDLELYAANYIQFSVLGHEVHLHKGLPAYPSPLKFSPEPDMLYENAGDGTFQDVSLESGIAASAGRGMGLVIFDFDGDADPDVMIANDSQANFLFENISDDRLRFRESALLAGVAYDFRGNSQGSMGVDVGDLNGDGLLDLYVTSFVDEFTAFYRSAGGGFLEDVTRLTNAGEGTFEHVTWGVVIEDFDSDGRKDIFVAAGHLDDQLRQRGGESRNTGFKVPNLLLWNRGGGRFVNLPQAWGPLAGQARSSRGAAAADFDNDGATDLVVLNSRDRPTLLKNMSPRSASSAIARLIGSKCNRDAVGAILRSSSLEEKTQVDIVTAGSSYQSSSSKTIRIAVPPGKTHVNAEVQWPGDERPQQVRLHAGSLNIVVQPP